MELKKGRNQNNGNQWKNPEPENFIPSAAQKENPSFIAHYRSSKNKMIKNALNNDLELDANNQNQKNEFSNPEVRDQQFQVKLRCFVS